MPYYVCVHKDSDSDYGVTVPDLPGCFSAGATLVEALQCAKEAVLSHIEFLRAEGGSVPSPKPLEEHCDNPLYRGGNWYLLGPIPFDFSISA